MPRRLLPAFLALILGFWGCTTTGPGASRNEIESVRRDLEAKRFRHKFQEEARLLRVGHRILQSLPPEERLNERPFVGIIFSENNKQVQRAFSLAEEKGLVVVGLLTREAAIRSGLEVGDRVTSIGGLAVARQKDYKKIVSDAKPGTHLRLQVRRRSFSFETEVPVQTVWRNISFTINDRKKEVNAYATLFGIQFTLPMMSFLKDDDELAVITGHEIAHIVKGHIGKGIGTSSLAGLLGGLAAIPLNLVLPGAGSVASFFVTSALEAQFSQEFEKEADYFGLLFAHRAGYDIRSGVKVWERFAVELPKRMSWGFLNTHPSTPERFVRTEKVIEELLR